MQPAAPLVDAATNLRRSSVVACVLGAASIVVLALFGHVLMGVFGCIGLALAAFNNHLLQRSVRSYTMDDGTSRPQFRRGVLSRLGLITVIAIGLALLVRPDGLGVFVGLAVFQILMLIGASVPVFRSLRPS